jgi:fatty-acyl-CoA synthase
MTAIGKVYKPRLRAEAVRSAMATLLAQHRLDHRVAVDVEEAASGLTIRYRVEDPGAEPILRDLMKPFALRFVVVPRAAT